jgi:hypothetical protein
MLLVQGGVLDSALPTKLPAPQQTRFKSLTWKEETTKKLITTWNALWVISA